MNWSSYNDALRQRGSLLILLDKDMMWLAPKAGRNGRPPVLGDGEDQQAIRGTACLTNVIQFCLMCKHGIHCRHQYRKVHLAMEKVTGNVCGVEGRCCTNLCGFSAFPDRATLSA